MEELQAVQLVVTIWQVKHLISQALQTFVMLSAIEVPLGHKATQELLPKRKKPFRQVMQTV